MASLHAGDRERRPAARLARGLALSLISLTSAIAGCGASSMMIHTRPENATVVVDGQEIGRSPVLYHGSSGWAGAVEVRARLEGYQEAVRRVPRDPNWYYLGEFFWFPPAVAGGWYLPDSVTLFLEPVPRRNP